MRTIVNLPLQPVRNRRVLTAVFALAAAGLAPWIVVLGVIQPQRATAVNNDGLRLVVLVTVVVLSAVAIGRPRTGPLVGTAAATLAALGAWFYGVTSTTAPTPVKAFGVAGLAVTAVSAGWLAVAAHRDRGREVGRGHRWRHRVLLLAAVMGVMLMLARPIGTTPSTAAVDDLKVAWVGLDVAELASLTLLAYALRTQASWTTVVAATTATLLSTDALINILPAAGSDRLVALAMAFVELPLAITALAVAVVWHRRGHPPDHTGSRAGEETRSNPSPPSSLCVSCSLPGGSARDHGEVPNPETPRGPSSEAEVWHEWSDAIVDANVAVVNEFKAHEGTVGGYFAGAPLLLLHHRGARTGTERVTPLVYLTDGETMVVAATKGGAPTNPSWYYNLRAHPRVSVDVGARNLVVVATDVTGAERDRLYRRLARMRPAFAEYESKTSRLIPMVRLTPEPDGRGENTSGRRRTV